MFVASFSVSLVLKCVDNSRTISEARNGLDKIYSSYVQGITILLSDLLLPMRQKSVLQRKKTVALFRLSPPKHSDYSQPWFKLGLPQTKKLI